MLPPMAVGVVPLVLSSWLVLASSADERALTTMVAQAAAEAPGAEVVTRQDVEQLLAIEGQKQATGCADSSDSCAAEIANALGAELVVRGELDTLDGQRTLTMTVMNTKRLGGTQRALLQADSVSGLGDKARAELPRLLSLARSSTDGAMRVYVLDVRAVGGRVNDSADTADHANTVDDGGGWPWQWAVGGGLLGVGVLGVALGVTGEVLTSSWQGDLDKTGAERLDQPAAAALYASRDRAALAGQVGWIVGGVGVVVGSGILLSALVGE